MSLLNSHFDIVSVDNPVALASLAQVLETSTAVTYLPNGTPKPGDIAPGAIVTMETTGASAGKAKLATSESGAAPQLVFITVDGTQDFSGSFVRKLTVLHGGVTVETDQVTGAVGAFTKGAALSFVSGKLVPWSDGLQRIGFVGPKGAWTVKVSANASEDIVVVQAILPQGCGI